MAVGLDHVFLYERKEGDMFEKPPSLLSVRFCILTSQRERGREREMEKKEEYRSHVLILPYPAQGHINPAIQFAKRLASKGLKATLATTVFINKSVKIQAKSVGVESISDGCDDVGFAEAGGTVEAYLDRLRTVGSRTLAQLIDKLAQSGPPVSCVIYDAFLPWALDVARGAGLVGAALFTQSCSVGAIYYHVFHKKLLVPLQDSSVSLPGLPKLDMPDVPSYFSEVGSYPAYLALVLNQFSNLDQADWVLFNTYDKLEPEAVKWMESLWRMKTIGPSLPSMFLDKRIEGDINYGINLYKLDRSTCMDWLEDKPESSVVYVSYGSMGLGPTGAEQNEELTLALKACSNYYFLWVLRDGEMKKLPTSFFEETKGKGLVLTWCPQLEVLAHKAVGCFVTHCGWNSTIEGVSLGVPMVCCPLWTDQPTNAKFVKDVWRVGVRASADEKGIVRSDEMEGCIKKVMEGERAGEMKKNASKWRELAIEAMSEGGSSDKNIDEFISTLVKA